MTNHLTWIMAALSLIIALMSYRFLLMGIPMAFQGVYDFYEFLSPNYLVAHVIAAPIALAAGALQFFPNLRARWPQMHRWVGRVKVLHAAGVVSRRIDKQRRLYSVRPESVQAIGSWTMNYREFWQGSLDRLSATMDQESDKL